MGGKKGKWEKDRERAERLAQGQPVGVLAGSLCGRLTLDGRVDDACDLARLFSEVDMVTGLEVDKGVGLAHAHSATVLGAALVLRLLGEGRATDAHRLVVLFTATKIGEGDYASLVPSA